MDSLRYNKEELLREEIVQAARQLFQQYGLFKTTMEDIAKAMGRGKSTLYYYYKSKDEIFDAVVITEINEIFETIKNEVEKADSASEKIKTYLTAMIKTVRNKINLYKIVTGELKENITTRAKLKEQYDNREIQFVKSIFSYGIETGEFTEEIEKDIELLSFLIVSSLRSFSVELLTNDKYASGEERIEYLASILIRGIRKTT
ncbi:MAG: TetR/AcrR family transcriptional regulator [Bacteroidota bacterium]|nr:TetR/AcrR family transcriptional regulator [Bacteroidota bacterium]